MPQPVRQLLVPSRSGGPWRLAAGALLVIATIPIESCAGRMPSQPADSTAAAEGVAALSMDSAATAPTVERAPSGPADALSFNASVRPVLSTRCAPCHEPGGKMYERLPFDDPKTIAANAEGISRRLKGDDLAALKRWLASLPPVASQN